MTPGISIKSQKPHTVEPALNCREKNVSHACVCDDLVMHDLYLAGLIFARISATNCHYILFNLHNLITAKNEVPPCDL